MAACIKNICFFNTNPVWGGAEKWHHTVARWFRDQGHAVLVVTNKESDLFHRVIRDAIPVSPLRITNLSFVNPVTVFAIAQMLQRHQIETLILNLPADAKVAGLAAKLAGVPQIIYRRGTALPVKNTALNRCIFKHLLTDVVANSQEIARTILQENSYLFPKDRLHVIYNGLDLDAFDQADSQPLYQRQGQKIVLGNAGRLVEQKGQRYLIDVAKALKTHGIEFVLYIAGTGVLESTLRRAVREQGLEKEVVLVGFVENMKGFLESLDIFLFPSLHEGSSNTLLEAMAAAKPVVAFDVSSIPEMVVSGETGLLVESGNVPAFTHAVLALVQDCAQRERLGQNGRTRLEKKFTQARMLEKIAHLVENT